MKTVTFAVRCGIDFVHKHSAMKLHSVLTGKSDTKIGTIGQNSFTDYHANTSFSECKECLRCCFSSKFHHKRSFGNCALCFCKTISANIIIFETKTSHINLESATNYKVINPFACRCLHDSIGSFHLCYVFFFSQQFNCAFFAEKLS